MRKFFNLLSATILFVLLSACGNQITGSNTTTASQAVGPDNVSLSWIAPTTRADGSYLPATQLAGYRIYMGTSATDLTPLVDLDDESITQYTVNNLSTGIYYFAITAFDTDGLESGLSQIVHKQV